MQLALWGLPLEEDQMHPALKAESVESLGKTLKESGCDGCVLAHEGRKQIVVYRGSTSARFMVVGEAPGAVEDSCGLPFSGPAGRKLDQIIRSVDLDPATDFYIGNIVKCRPIDHSGIRQNVTPSSECARSCRPFIEKEIELIRPRAVLCAGLTAAKHLIDFKGTPRMKDHAGGIYKNPKFPDTDFVVMYHPAAILHASDNPTLCNHIRNSIWKTIKDFKRKYVESG